MNNLQKLVLSKDCLIKDVMSVLDREGNGIVFLSEKDGRIVGLLTDGDVRRAILQKAELTSPAYAYAKKQFKSASSKTAREENLKLLTEEVRHLPILDDQGRLVDLLSWAEMWRMPIMEPMMSGNELKYVADCITSNWISSQGSYVKLFESKFAEYHGVTHAVTTSNGTTALHLALTALGIGPGDEVIVPDLTFAASANAVIHAGAKPVLVDVDAEYWNMDPAALEAALSPKTKAIMPVHLYGHPCDMDPILAFAKKHRLLVIEDCAEALGAEYKGRKVGTFGDASCFSFFSNKVITTGEGGMVLTENKKLFDRMTMLRDHGMSRQKRYWHEEAGFNYRMTNVQAAIGVAQLEQIHRFLDQRLRIAKRYHEGLKGLPGITLPPEMPWAKNIFWLYSILVDGKASGIERDPLIRNLSKEGVETRSLFYPLHVQPPYASNRAFPVTDRLSRQGLSLPSSCGLSDEDITKVCRVLKAQLEHGQIMSKLKV